MAFYSPNEMKERKKIVCSTDKWLYIRAKFYVLNTMPVNVLGYLSRSGGKVAFRSHKRKYQQQQIG